MRFPLVGFILLCIAGVVLAQAEGEVESIGFDGNYRPNTLTPMKLRIRPTVGIPQSYKLAVVQEDLDRERVLYTRPFTLNGNPEGGRIEEHVWVTFLPQPRELRGAANAAELSNIVKVFLCTESGKQLLQIPIPSSTPLMKDIDQPQVFGANRGTRLILTLGTAQSRPVRSAYAGARGITEEVLFTPVSLADLPENALAWQAVDALMWLNADPAELRPETASAIQEYVRDGGRLVVCQNPLMWQKMMDSPLAEMLPVTIEGVEDEKGLATLRELAGLPPPGMKIAPGVGVLSNAAFDPWADTVDRVSQVAVAMVHSETRPLMSGPVRTAPVVAKWRKSGDAQTPYMVRWMYGAGVVTWVAQDLGDPSVQSTTNLRQLGWPQIWDKVFDWRNETVTPQMAGQFAGSKTAFDGTYKDVNNNTDLSRSMLDAMEAKSTAAALVALAIVFFIGYWLVAGPGSYFFLLSRRQSQQSWLAFAACAVAATLLTLVVVKLVLRGKPELHHITFVRVLPRNVDGDPVNAIARSSFGLYIKRDGMQTIELKETEAKRASYILPYAGHPDHFSTDAGGFPGYVEYEIPIRDRNAGDSTAVSVPFRSTLKKLQAQWIGQLSGGIDGRARLADGALSGRLLNNTGIDLRSVYLVYAQSPGSRDDMMISLRESGGVSAWPKGKTINLADIVADAAAVGQKDTTGFRTRDTLATRGLLNLAWMAKENWGGQLGNSMDGGFSGNRDQAAVLMSIYDRLAPSRGEARQNSYNDRYELLRRGSRWIDASGAVSCGQLLVIARSDEGAPLPFPLEVEGDRVPGEGLTYYQFVIGLDRSGSSTQPAGSDVEYPVESASR